MLYFIMILLTVAPMLKVKVSEVTSITKVKKVLIDNLGVIN